MIWLFSIMFWSDSSVVESSPSEEVAQDCSPATTSSGATSGAPLPTSAPSSPVTSPPQESPPPPASSSSESEHQAPEETSSVASSGIITLEGELPTNLTGARKRKAHRVVKREVSQSMTTIRWEFFFIS